jgi:hypothetical protein
MRRTPSLWHIILALSLIVTSSQPAEWPVKIWDKRLMPPARIRQHRNPRRNRERWARRWAKRQRRQPPMSRAQRRRRRKRVLRQLLETERAPYLAEQERERSVRAIQSLGSKRKQREQSKRASKTSNEGTDPLAALRRGRGWIDHVDERELWELLIQVRWPDGPVCPCCGERDSRYLKLMDPDYRGGLGRWQCRVCAEAGDPGEGGTFTPLTGTILNGMRIDIRTLWLLVELFADGKASVETAKETGVDRHTTDRWFRLLRAAIYQARSADPIALEAEDVAECDEVYITAGLKGRAGGLKLEREPRKRGLKRRGRGTWDTLCQPPWPLIGVRK